MKKYYVLKVLVLIVLSFFIVGKTKSSLSSLMAGEVAEGHLTKHVIILVMDGARYSETWGDASHRYISNIANEIAPQGTVLAEFRNSGYTETTAGHTALTTGVNQNINNSGAEYPANPGICHYLRKQYSLSRESVWVSTSKDKLQVLAKTTAPGWEIFNPAIDCGVNGDGSGGYRDDAVTFSHACAELTNYHPRFMIINMKDPDSSGHKNDWASYLSSISNIDVSASLLWKLVVADRELSNTTALFIVNDHGRHLDNVKDGFVSHGDDCQGCRHILCVAVGPDFKTNNISVVRHDQRDVTATAAYLLDVAMPTSKGKVMREILK